MNNYPDLFIEPADLKALDSLEINDELLQSGFWACFREAFGWKARAFHCLYQDNEFYLLVLIRDLKFGFKLAYIPYGLDCAEHESGREAFLVCFAQKLRAFLPAKTVFIRYDLPWAKTGNMSEVLDTESGLKKAPVDIQPSSTVLLDLSLSEKDILSGMKAKTRYNIRLSEKKQVKVEQGSIEDLPDWYDLYRETARRDRITLHSFEYYEKLFHLAPEYNKPDNKQGNTSNLKLKLLLARHEGELLAGIIIALKGKNARYLYGASSSIKRNLMPAYALQWQAIRLAGNAGCTTYDLFGIPPVNDPTHPMYGLYRFKTGFGGKIIHRYGCYDFPLCSFWYKTYRTVEKTRHFYFFTLRKRLHNRRF